jgi:predicted aminopeptidase
MTRMTLPFSPILALLFLGLLLPVAGCQSLGYYAHVTRGQLQLLSARQPVDRVLRDLADTPGEPAARLAGQIERSQTVLDFAEGTLGLPVGRRYRTYVDLGRPYVVWNVFAAPEFSLEPHRWCYPVAGCAPYRGYFSAAAAARESARLAAGGMDVHIGGVAAYSTLGWFADPLLSSFIGWPEPDLAELLIHELAHGKLWVPGDVPFNESYATFVGKHGAAGMRGAAGMKGAAAWRSETDDSSRDPDAWRRLVGLLAQTRAQLAIVYQGADDPATRRARKATVIAATQACYAAHRGRLGGGRYDGLVAGLNNALLASISAYEDLVPAFARLFETAAGDWKTFHAAVGEVAALPRAERQALLARLRDEQIAADADHEHADEVQCETF